METWLRHNADFEEFAAITADDTVVDIGCGAGEASVAAGRLGAEVIAIDIDPALVGHVANRMRGVSARSFRGIASDCNPIPLPDGVASVVLCTEVMEHVDDPAVFLAELNRIGKPGAVYLLSVPDPASEALMRVVAHRSYFRKPNHQHVFEHERLDGLMQAAGLEVVRRPHYPNNFYWAMWCLLRWAASAGGDPEPGAEPPVLRDWHNVWTSLGTTPRGVRAMAHLDRILPRSQVVVARKAASARRRPRGHFLKAGAIRLGRIDVSWRVHHGSSST